LRASCRTLRHRNHFRPVAQPIQIVGPPHHQLTPLPEPASA
jgi:hypothetical protein